MQEAARIRDVAARHSYVFDSGLSSPDFFDVEKRMDSEEFWLLREHCGNQSNVIFEIGCFTGLNLLGLGTLGYQELYGIDFVMGAVLWLNGQAKSRNLPIDARRIAFENFYPSQLADRVICFDVLEHQLNVGQFLDGVRNVLADDGESLFLVPEGEAYYDCGHVAFFPDAECLRNVLDYFFEVVEIRRLESCPKLFARCRRRS